MLTQEQIDAATGLFQQMNARSHRESPAVCSTHGTRTQPSRKEKGKS